MKGDVLRTTRRPSRPRRGFTLIEVLVVIAVIGLLVALSIPAIQAAREASRRVHCAANLRQLGLALNQYLGASGVLPAGNNNRGFSHYVMILPYLEQNAIYQSINFSFPPYLPPPAPNDTAARVSLGVLLCPSDPGAARIAGATCYAGNQGVGFCKNTPYGTCDNGAFIWPGSPAIGQQAFTDGTSSTVMIAEWVVTSGATAANDSRHWVYSIPTHYTEPSQFDQFVSECHSAGLGMRAPGFAIGESWFHGSSPNTLYNHAEPINDHNCLNGGRYIQQSAWTSGSLHPHGANVLFVDGHVRFLGTSLGPRTWRSLGTRAGHEVISSDSL